MKEKKNPKLIIVYIVRYGCSDLGVSFYGVFKKSREDVIKMMIEYNQYRGGKYPMIQIIETTLGSAGNWERPEEIILSDFTRYKPEKTYTVSEEVQAIYKKFGLFI